MVVMLDYDDFGGEQEVLCVGRETAHDQYQF